MKLVLLCLALLVPESFAAEIPDFFRGSPEMFSGYLPNSKKFVESFTYTKGLIIEGNSTQVEKILTESNPRGKFTKRFFVFELLRL